MRSRAGYIVLFLALVATAFIARIAFGWLYLPDLLTASFVYVFMRMLFFNMPGWKIAASAFGLCLIVELSQLYHGPLIDRIRDTVPGRFVLGNQFDGLDIISFVIGNLLAWYIDDKIRGY